MLRRLVSGILVAHAAAAAHAQAPDFMVGDIRVEGLQRIAENDAAAAEEGEGEGADTPGAGTPGDNADGTSEA